MNLFYDIEFSIMFSKNDVRVEFGLPNLVNSYLDISGAS